MAWGYSCTYNNDKSEEMIMHFGFKDGYGCYAIATFIYMYKFN